MSNITKEARDKAGEPTLEATKAQQSWSVEKVIATEFPIIPKENTESPVPFFHMLERLKTTKREGWRRFGISRYVFKKY
ncbi:hypothetical protein EYC80_008215 [Monilinia laxa]|uniref:Uncharacterized protein n=1 Tax=Monilinia laxa TaxID=61186 RepID=A0A5N6JVQ3_MONLA|nr:hypothetical protein EYC80_008215 [Monilinia laxa]